MDKDIEIALISGGPPTLVALAAFVVGWWNKNAIQNVHLSINSRMDQLLAAANAQGRQDERNERGEDAGEDSLSNP